MTDDTAKQEQPQYGLTEQEAKDAAEAHAASRENTSTPDRASRDLWQTANVSTDGNGPRVEDVSPIFAQARADALGNPASQDGSVDEDTQVSNEDAAAAAQAEADAIRDAQGYVAPTGPDAGNYDDAKFENTVPGENFNPAPERSEEERSADEAAQAEQAKTAGAQSVYHDEVDQRAPEVPAEAPADEAPADESKTSKTKTK